MYTLKNYKDLLNLCLKANNENERLSVPKNPEASVPEDLSTGKFGNEKSNVGNEAAELKNKTVELKNDAKKLGDIGARGGPSLSENEGHPIEIGSFQVNEGGVLVAGGLPESFKGGEKLQFNSKEASEKYGEASVGQPTYGTSLPETVSTLEVDGEIYERSGINGEFYRKSKDGEPVVPNNERKPLEMKDGQIVSVLDVRTDEDIETLKEGNRVKFDELVGENGPLKEYRGNKEYEAVILGALEKGIDPEDVIEEFEVSTFGNNNDSDDYSDSAAQTTLTNAAFKNPVQVIGGNGLSRDKYKRGEIQSYSGETNVEPGTMTHYNIPNASEPYAHSGTSTLCSQTARLNLEKMGCAGVVRGNAFDAWKKMGSPKNPFPPKENGNIKAIDLRVGSRSSYGHRAAAFVDKNGKWFVLDPYRNGKSTAPIPAEEYMSKNQVVGAFYYSLKS